MCEGIISAQDALNYIKEFGEFLVIRLHDGDTFMMSEANRTPCKTLKEAEVLAQKLVRDNIPVVVVQIRSIIGQIIPPTNIIRLSK